MATKKTTKKTAKKATKKAKPHKDISLESYEHKTDKRKNNPSVGLVTTQTDKEEGRTTYQYDPHLDPQLVWAGKKERESFEVPNVSLHVHERIDPRTIAKSFIKEKEQSLQPSLFDTDRDVPLSKAVHFYAHEEQWANRLIAGDSLQVMHSLLYKEGMAGKLQMMYFDPPYGIKYNSNFQPFTNKTQVKDNNDADIPGEPEMIKAFRDTWELGIHSYLTYLRDRLKLGRELLNETGSCFVQINDENLDYVKQLMREVFGEENYIDTIPFWKTSGLQQNFLPSVCDYLVWFAKDKKQVKYHQLYLDKRLGESGSTAYSQVELEDGTVRPITKEEVLTSKLEKGARVFTSGDLQSQGNPIVEFEFNGKVYKGRWKTNLAGMQKLAELGRIIETKNVIRYKRYLDDFPVYPITSLWTDTGTGGGYKSYVVQTNEKVLQRCILMTTDPGDLVFDPTCGSGTTAAVAEQWGRRWITCDTSRVAITLARQRLMASKFDYYELAHPEEGVKSGFDYKKVQRVTLGSLANNEEASEVVLIDQPKKIKDTVRCTGPFTLEAVPSVRVKPFDGNLPDTLSEKDLAKNGLTALNQKWIDEMQSAGIRATGGKVIEFATISHKEGSSYIHAEGEVREDDGNMSKANVVFANETGPLEQRQVELALRETMEEKDRPAHLIFAAFQFDPEAAKDIDQIKVDGMNVLKVQMNTDLLTEDLRKKRSSNESYWLIGQPAIDVIKAEDGKYQVQVRGFDYYNPATGEMDSAGVNRVAMWMLDTDYDERSLYPTQVFFPQGDSKRDWTKLAKALNGSVDEELLEFFTSDISLPFTLGEHKKVAVKIIDDRGIESLVIKEIK